MDWELSFSQMILEKDILDRTVRKHQLVLVCMGIGLAHAELLDLDGSFEPVDMLFEVWYESFKR